MCEAGVEALRTGAKVAVQLEARPGAGTAVPTAGIQAPDLEAAL